MKTLTTLLALALFCATGHGQTIKSLGYNTINGEVVANTGTNVLTFTNEANFTSIRVGGDAIIDDGGKVLWDTNQLVELETFTISQAPDFEGTAAAITRTNLGLPLPALTNTSNADMLSALGAAQTIFTVKTNDQTIINETNATTITDLTFATEPGARYVVTFYPIVEAEVGGTVFQVVASNATVYGTWNFHATGFGSTNVLTNEASSSVTGARGFLQTFYVEGATNAGAINVAFRSGPETNTNTIKAGSFMRADKMP